MRVALIGVAALGILWLAMWATGSAPGAGARSPDGLTSTADFAQRIGGAPQSVAGLKIAVSPEQVRPALGPTAVPVRHDRATAKAVWGAPAEFAPPEN